MLETAHAQQHYTVMHGTLISIIIIEVIANAFTDITLYNIYIYTCRMWM